MGGMKDEAKRITIPPLFPKVHVNETRRRDKTVSLYKHSTTKFFDSPSNLSLSLPPPPNNASITHFSPICNTSPTSKFEGKMNKKGMNNPSPEGSSVTNTKPSSIKQNEHHFKNLNNLNYLQVPLVKRSETDQQANTDLSFQFCTSSKAGETTDSKCPLTTLPFSEYLEDASQNKKSLNVMMTQLTKRNLAGFNNETQKKPKTVPWCEQDVSDSCVIDPLSGMSASSKAIVRVIGEKRFWRMRTYMINQQKIFAEQVFELHRLITVQKMVVKSPNLVLESKLNGNKSGTMSSYHLMEMAASKVRKPNTENHKPVTEEYPELMKQKLPLLPFISKELVNPIWPQQLLPPPRNQWLVPVMSPSEGLVYKPYEGPCPPPASAFMVPVYGQDSLETAFRFPVSPQFNSSYFLPTNERRTVDKTNPFGQFQRWSSTSSHMTQAIPFSLRKSQGSNESTASSPPEKHKLELLPLFPTEPTDYKQTQHRATKAIPHNPTSASESASRIFHFIQEERRDSDHVIG